MYDSLPSPLRQWVADQAEKMGLPGPDSYILLLIRMEKQRQQLEAAVSPPREDKYNPSGVASPDALQRPLPAL